MEEKLLVEFAAKVTPVKPINDEMTLCKCFVMALGKNNNKSNISKKAVEKALPTLFNIPVKGHLYINDDDELCMGGHDKILVKTDDGYVLQRLTVPYGVVPYQDNVHFEEVEEPDGTKKEYLVADVILWTGQFPELLDAKYNDEIYFNQSMEIKCTKTTKKDGIMNIEAFKFSALCLLGKSDDPNKNNDPCFKMSVIEPYKFSLNKNWENLFEEFKNKLEESYATYSFEKGGKKVMDTEKINSILAEFNLDSVEKLPFEITAEMTEEELRTKLAEEISDNQLGKDTTENDFSQEVVPESNNEETVPATAEGVVGEHVEGTLKTEEESPEFSLLHSEKRDRIWNSVRDMSDFNIRGSKDFWMIDYDDTYVYVGYCVVADGKTDRGHVRLKYSEVDSQIVVDTTEMEEVHCQWLTSAEIKNLQEKEVEYARLVEYESNKIKEERNNSFSKVISEFSDLSEIDEYKVVVGSALEFADEEALREKLFALRGKYMKAAPKKSLDAIAIGISKEVKQNNTVETAFFSKYLPEVLNKK